MLPRRAARRARGRAGVDPYASVSPMQPNQSGLPVDLLILSGRQIPVGWAPVGRSAAVSPAPAKATATQVADHIADHHHHDASVRLIGRHSLNV